MELFGSVAVITGAASQVGRIIACSLFRAGAFVFLTDSNEKLGRETLEMLSEYGHQLQKRSFVPLDNTDSDSIQTAAATILDHTGEVDIFVNTIDTRERNSIAAGSTLLPAILPSMMRTGGGKIILVENDVAAPLPFADKVIAPERADEIKSTIQLAEKLERHGISVNCLRVEHNQALMQDLPISRCANGPVANAARPREYPSEIADAVMLFATASSNHFNGQTLNLNC